MSNTIKIERGRYSARFQVARAWLSAASALAPTDARRAADHIDAAITELRKLRSTIIADGGN